RLAKHVHDRRERLKDRRQDRRERLERDTERRQVLQQPAELLEVDPRIEDVPQQLEPGRDELADLRADLRGDVLERTHRLRDRLDPQRKLREDTAQEASAGATKRRRQVLHGTLNSATHRLRDATSGRRSRRRERLEISLALRR